MTTSLVMPSSLKMSNCLALATWDGKDGYESRKMDSKTIVSDSETSVCDSIFALRAKFQLFKFHMFMMCIFAFIEEAYLRIRRT